MLLDALKAVSPSQRNSKKGGDKGREDSRFSPFAIIGIKELLITELHPTANEPSSIASVVTLTIVGLSVSNKCWDDTK